MDISDFDFELPEELIAQQPLQDRTASRMLVLDREERTITHRMFPDLLEYLNAGDCLVLNDTRVMPARLYGVREATGANVEILLLHQTVGDMWEVLVKPAKKVKLGTVLRFGDGRLKAECVEEKEHGGRIVDFSYDGIFYEILDELGEMPPPPYITEQLPERERYQTVYAKESGSAAAPTAGLHFTEDILEAIRKIGVRIEMITLHVGLGTFRPVHVQDVEEHDMHSEFYHMNQETADVLNQVKRESGRIIAVGTTSTRTLETIARDNDGYFHAASGWTDIYIRPPYHFQAVDGLLTNFHLPKSTLIMLVSAFAGREFILKAYQEAIDKRYRFFSFGDAMLLF